MEGYCSRVLEKSIATVYVCAFSYMSFPHAYCCCFSCSIYLLVCMNICVHIDVRLCCIYVIHLSHAHNDVIVALLINTSMYIWLVRLLFYSFHGNDNRSFRVTIF